jgi:hypothetical protein
MSAPFLCAQFMGFRDNIPMLSLYVKKAKILGKIQEIS